MKAKVIELKIQIHIHLWKQPEYIRSAITNVMQLKDNMHPCEIENRFQNFPIKTLIRDFPIKTLFASFNGRVPKTAFSNDLKDVVMKNFPGGLPPDPHLCLFRLHMVSVPLDLLQGDLMQVRPPPYEFRSDGPDREEV